MNKIKWVIIGVGIVIVILIVLLMATGNNEKNNQKVPSEDENKIQNSTEKPTKLSSLKDNQALEIGYIDFYTVSNCITEYLNRVNVNNSSYYSVDENGNNNRIISDEEIKNRIRSIAIGDNINLLREQEIFIPIQISKATSNKVATYKVYGATANLNMEYIRDVIFIVNLDTKKFTYSVQEVNTEETDLNKIQVTEIESIEKNQYNTFTYQELSDEYKYKQIFGNMKKLMLVKPEIAYEKLDKDYRKIRFANYEEFINYINNNRETLVGVNPEKFKTNDDNTILTIQDQNKNRYQFKMIGTMQYEAKIDNYVIMNEDDIDWYYEKFDKQEQIEYSIQRWLKMIEYKDYRCAYEFLDEEFRNKKFGSVESFANYINKLYNKDSGYAIGKATKDGNIYETELTISKQDDEFSDKYLNVIIKLDDNAEFTMSFSEE